jgi:transposase
MTRDKKILKYFYKTGDRLKDVAKTFDIDVHVVSKIITKDLYKRYEDKRKKREKRFGKRQTEFRAKKSFKLLG